MRITITTTLVNIFETEKYSSANELFADIIAKVDIAQIKATKGIPFNFVSKKTGKINRAIFNGINDEFYSDNYVLPRRIVNVLCDSVYC